MDTVQIGDVTVCMPGWDDIPAGRKPPLVATRDGQVLWRLAPPNNMEPFTAISARDGLLHAYSYSGFLLTIDPETGDVVETVFTK